MTCKTRVTWRRGVAEATLMPVSFSTGPDYYRLMAFTPKVEVQHCALSQAAAQTVSLHAPSTFASDFADVYLD